MLIEYEHRFLSRFSPSLPLSPLSLAFSLQFFSTSAVRCIIDPHCFPSFRKFETWKAGTEAAKKQLRSHLVVALPPKRGMPQYAVNFDFEIQKLMHEAKYLQLLGFQIPHVSCLFVFCSQSVSLTFSRFERSHCAMITIIIMLGGASDVVAGRQTEGLQRSTHSPPEHVQPCVRPHHRRCAHPG